MEKITKDISEIIAGEIKTINDKVRGLNFLELLKASIMEKLLELVNRQYAVCRFDMFFQKSFLFYLEYNSTTNDSFISEGRSILSGIDLKTPSIFFIDSIILGSAEILASNSIASPVIMSPICVQRIVLGLPPI